MRRLGCGVAISAAMSGAFVPAAMASSVSPAAASRLSAPMSAPVISDTVLDRMRGIGDPAADRVVAALTARGQLPAVNKLLRQWVYNDQPLPSGLPSDLASFIDKARQLPSWADLSRITAAAQFGQAHMSYLALAYSMGVSTAAFTYPILASVFDPNVGIFLDFQKRLLGSLKLISGVYDPNAFGPHGQIIPDLIKVRLMHAAVRDYLDDSRWDRAKWGVAISQEAMLVETWLFGVFALNAMQGFGVQIPTDIATDFLHTWRVEGTMLGVPAGAMPTDLPTANALFSQLEDRDQWSSPQGRYLLNTFINQAGKYMSGPGGVDISPILISVIRCALGPRLADMLGVPKSLWDDEVDPALHNLQATTTENAGPLSWFVQVINDLLGDNVQMVTLKGEPVYLDIPSYRIPARASLPGGRHGSADLSGDTRRERFRSGARRAPRRARPAVRVQVQGVHRRQLGAGR
jgi:endo-cleaving rubber dioxygenase